MTKSLNATHKYEGVGTGDPKV